MKNLFQKTLFRCARAIIWKYKPKVVAITGSVGKTSAKEAVFAVLDSKFKARKNIKNYNNEFGLPFSIMGVESPRRNPLKWIFVLLRSFWMIYFFSDYPKILVLEVGIDRPGDMDKIMDLIKPDIGVLTAVGLSHLEFFHTEQEIFEEKVKIFRDFSTKDTAIINADDSKARQAIARVHSKIITYGFDHSADLHITDHKTTYAKNNSAYGTSFHLHYKNENIGVFLGNTFGMPHVYAAAAGAATGLVMGMTLSEISAALIKYQPEPGRMRAIEGVNRSVIIDDTYNAAPASMKVAIEELVHFPVAKKIVVLGDMLELGSISEQEHRAVAEQLIKASIDYAIFVGPFMKAAYDVLQKRGFKKDHLFWFEKSTDAIDVLKTLLHENTAALVKGSQGMRMEKITKEMMRDKSKAAKLLCRQDPSWLNK